jgi:hypothetical protein
VSGLRQFLALAVMSGSALLGTAEGQISTAGLKLRLNFDGSGQTLSDSSGNGNDCRLGSTAGSDANDPARITEGLQFDGGDFVDCLRTSFGTTSLFAQASESFTIQIVGMQPSDATSMFAARSTGSQTTFELGSLSASGVRATLRGTSTTIQTPTPTNQWHLWTVRWDGAAASGRMDHGSDVALGTGSGSDGAENLAIGARSISTGGANFLPNGSKMAVVLVYDRALADSEMRRQYCAIREYVGSKSVVLPDANCPSANTYTLSALTFMGMPLRVANEGMPSSAMTQTDCAPLMASYQAAAGQADPYELSGEEHDDGGDACLVTAGVPVR